MDYKIQVNAHISKLYFSLSLQPQYIKRFWSHLVDHLNFDQKIYAGHKKCSWQNFVKIGFHKTVWLCTCVITGKKRNFQPALVWIRLTSVLQNPWEQLLENRLFYRNCWWYPSFLFIVVSKQTLFFSGLDQETEIVEGEYADPSPYILPSFVLG